MAQGTWRNTTLQGAVNAQRVKSAVVEYWNEYQKIPTQKELHELTGLAPRTITKHLSRMNLADVIGELLPFGTMVSEELLKTALQSEDLTAKNAAMKTYFKLLEKTYRDNRTDLEDESLQTKNELLQKQSEALGSLMDDQFDLFQEIEDAYAEVPETDEKAAS